MSARLDRGSCLGIAATIFGENVKGDVSGGLSSAVLSLPVAIAFGVAIYAPLGPEYAAVGAAAGMYGAIFAGIFASFFGGTPAMITAPTASQAVISVVIVVSLIQKLCGTQTPSPEQVQAVINEVLLLTFFVILLGGVVRILLGLVRGGRLIKYIPYPVIAGFMNGVAIIIFLGQVEPFLGLHKESLIWDFSPRFFDDAVGFLPLVIAGGVTILSILVSPKVTKKIPPFLVGLVLGTAAFYIVAFFFQSHFPALLASGSNPYVVGSIPSTFPLPTNLGEFDNVFKLLREDTSLIITIIPMAVTLGILGAIDSLLTALVADVATKTRHNSNRELVGQGIGNIIASFFGGIACAGATGRTLANIQSGGRNRLSAILCSVVLLVVLIGLGQPAGRIPMAVLAGLLVILSFKIIDTYSFSLIRKKTALKDLFVIALVTTITVFIDLMTAVGVGLLITALLFFRELIGIPVFRKKYRCAAFRSKRVRSEPSEAILREHGDKILVYELQGSLFFGTADKLLTDVDQELHGTEYILFDLRRVETIDITGANLLKRICQEVKGRGARFGLSNLYGESEKRQRLIRFLSDLEVLSAVGPKNIFEDVDRALETLEGELVERFRTLPTREDGIIPLAEVEIFQGLRSEQVSRVEGALKIRKFAKDEVIFKEGDPGNALYIIGRGCVSILADVSGEKNKRLTTFGEGLYFGEMALLEEAPRSATAVAEEETELFVLDKEDFERIIHKDSDIGMKILLGIAKGLSHRLRVTGNELKAIDGV
jgi:SulP family sulfate permease